MMWPFSEIYPSLGFEFCGIPALRREEAAVFRFAGATDDMYIL